MATLRAGLMRMSAQVDAYIVDYERRHRLLGSDTVSVSRGMSQAELRAEYDGSFSAAYDAKEEKLPAFADRLIGAVIHPFLDDSSSVLEIGAGGGRWTAVLAKRTGPGQVVAADISAAALARCRERFAAAVETRLIGVGGDLPVAADSIDFVWAFDVFVLLTPVQVDRYLHEIHRALRTGGRAVIHHVGGKSHGASMDQGFFAALAQLNGLQVESQRSDLAYGPCDYVTVLLRRRPPGATGPEYLPRAEVLAVTGAHPMQRHRARTPVWCVPTRASLGCPKTLLEVVESEARVGLRCKT